MVKTMRVLLLHPEDDPTRGLWVRQDWDLVLDLGMAGAPIYERWSKALGCRVEPLAKIDDNGFEQIRHAMAAGSGFLIDDHGLDWWDLIALEFHQKLEQAVRIQNACASIGAQVEWSATRACFQANALEITMGSPVRCFTHGIVVPKVRHYMHAASRLSPAQLLQIAGDKYDPGYQLRRHLASPPKPSAEPLVLLPSAYVNVSRTGLQYAEILPELDFLLITTRNSGWVKKLARNVMVQKLASYAPAPNGESALQSLLTRWIRLKKKLESAPLFSVLVRSGALECVPKMLRTGLMVRDAWLQVFERHNVSAVLCADDGNRFTQLPLLIAEKCGLPAIACHHGALDGRHRIRPKQDYLFLAKGRMERDYMVRICGVAPERVEIAAPPRPSELPSRAPRSIIFFSEPYEVAGGRCREFYGQVLPSLARVATSMRCDLVVKLHPFESDRERRKLMSEVLSREQMCNVRIVSGALTDSLLAETVCAVTILSTTAVDCALRGIPVLLCEWLDYSDYGYLQQFAKFRAGASLRSPEDLASIPSMLEKFSPIDKGDLWHPITPDRLRALLSGCVEAAIAV